MGARVRGSCTLYLLHVVATVCVCAFGAATLVCVQDSSLALGLETASSGPCVNKGVESSTLVCGCEKDSFF